MCRPELFDPAVGHRAYNEYLDELEYAASVGFDGICVNEHHQNAYGMMPSPNLMAAALARRTSGVKLVLMGNSVALYNPPTRVAEEMAMLDVLSGGRLVAGFPVGTPMDTTYCYGAVAGDPAREIPRGRRADPARLERARRVLVQRQVHPASLRQHLAAADAETAAAGLGAGRRQRRDLGSVPGERLPLRQPVLLRLPGRPEDHGRVLERGRSPQAAATIRIAPASCSSSPSPTATPRPSGFTRSRRCISISAACTSMPAT